MKNNWKEVAEQLLKQDTNIGQFELHDNIEEVLSVMLEAMNLVFEATKKECADKANMSYDREGSREIGYNITKINKESILNINKPNL